MFLTGGCDVCVCGSLGGQPVAKPFATVQEPPAPDVKVSAPVGIERLEPGVANRSNKPTPDDVIGFK